MIEIPKYMHVKNFNESQKPQKFQYLKSIDQPFNSRRLKKAYEYNEDKGPRNKKKNSLFKFSNKKAFNAEKEKILLTI